MPLFERLTPSTFQYMDLRSYMTHISRTSPSALHPVIPTAADNELLHDFEYLGNFLFNHTNDVLRTGGLFHIREFARQMIQFDQELTRRVGGDEWANRDLSEMRSVLARLANITILRPDMPRPNPRMGRPDSPVPRPSNSMYPSGGRAPGIDCEDALAEPMYPTTGARPRPSNSPHYRSAIDWILAESVSPTNIAPGLNATSDGATSFAGLRIRIGRAGDHGLIQGQFIEEGELAAQSDFDSGRKRRQRSHNPDFQDGYDRRWRALQ